MLDAVFDERDLADWRRILDGAGVTFGIVGTVDEIADDPQMRAIGALVPFQGSDMLTVSSPFQLEGETKVTPRFAPKVGEHSETVLREAGFSADEIDRLRERGVVG